MPEIKEGNVFTQVVQFDVATEKQGALIEAITGEVERWVRRRRGFISSTFHASHDGKHVLNYAQWASEDAFKAFGKDPESRKLQEAIRSVDENAKPHAIHYQVVKSITP